MTAITSTVLGFFGFWPFFPFFFLWPVVAVVLLLRRRGHPFWSDARRAEDLLAERYARGDISADEYTERLAVLRGTER
jgi:uncharacterized membrane protein